jgi:hypothetical protein
MFSANLRLNEALAKLDTKDVRVQAALAVTQANWHASRQAWPEAALAFDRLLAADPTNPEGWLRTPGLLRLATALLHQNRPRDAAALLQGGARRRASDGLPMIELTGERLVNDAATGELLHPLRATLNERIAEEPRNPGLLELRAELAGQWSDAKAQAEDYTAAIKILAEPSAGGAAGRTERVPAPRCSRSQISGRIGEIAYRIAQRNQPPPPAPGQAPQPARDQGPTPTPREISVPAA